MSKYRYSQRIGRGGMAEVFLGMQEGIGGFEKLVVIKRIFQHYCEDERFVQMFMDEARLAASIRHPNVVEILDIDRDATGFFIVMEYLSGETLGYVIPTLQSQDMLPPPHLVCRIGAAIAAGLHQAHTAQDATGAPQPVVHRDVTPSNVIVCYNGVVKLLDFGVAKAITMSGEGETRVRGVKGKLSYLAPEQISNAPVDARTDIFQLGIVIHEMLTGRGLFHAGNAHQRVLAVMDREIPRPSLVHPGVPPMLDEIVLAALERDPDKRVQTADELRGRLEQAVVSMGESATDRDVGAWMRETFSDAYSRRLALERSTASHMRQSRQVISSGIASWAPGSQTGEGSQPSYPGGGVFTSPSHPMLLASHEPGTMTMASEALHHRGTMPQRKRRTWLVAALLLLLVAGGTGIAISIADGDANVRAAAVPGDPNATQAVKVDIAQTTTEDPPERPKNTAGEEPKELAKYQVVVETSPASASIELDGTVIGHGAFAREFTADGNNHVLVIAAEGFKPRIVTFRDEPPERLIALQAIPSAGDGDRRFNRGGRGARRGGRAPEPAETTRPEQTRASEPTPPPEPEEKPEQRRRPDLKRPSTDNLDPWAD